MWVAVQNTWDGIEEVVGPFDNRAEADEWGDQHGYGMLSGYEVKDPNDPDL